MLHRVQTPGFSLILTKKVVKIKKINKIVLITNININEIPKK